MRSRNNLMAISGVALVIFLCCIPMDWFSLTESSGMSIDVTGHNATLDAPFPLPIWFILVLSALATLLAILNVTEVTSIPRFITLSLLLFAGMFYAIAILHPESSLGTHEIEIESGPGVAIADTLLMTIVICMAPRPKAPEA